MPNFNGFPPGKTSTTVIPNLFFSELLAAIDDLAELKITLYCFWALQQQEGEHRYVLRRDLLDDRLLLTGLNPDPEKAAACAEAALDRATQRGTLLRATVDGVQGTEVLYFLNSARGRNAIRAIEAGQFVFGGRECPVALVIERPNIFSLYEQNIGPLTPMIGERLREAEQEYAAEWIAEAIQIAVERNHRNWRYVSGILKRWQAEGKDSGSTQRSTQADRYDYIRGELSDFIEY